MVNHHWFRKLLGAVQQQAITWASIDQDFPYNLTSLGYNEFLLNLFGHFEWRHPIHTDESLQARHLQEQT